MPSYSGGLATRNKPFRYRAEYDSNNYVIYEGWSQPGTAEATAGWQIVKHTYVNDNLTESNWANGSGAMDKKWTLRSTTYSY